MRLRSWHGLWHPHGALFLFVLHVFVTVNNALRRRPLLSGLVPVERYIGSWTKYALRGGTSLRYVSAGQGIMAGRESRCEKHGRISLTSERSDAKLIFNVGTLRKYCFSSSSPGYAKAGCFGDGFGMHDRVRHSEPQRGQQIQRRNLCHRSQGCSRAGLRPGRCGAAVGTRAFRADRSVSYS